MIIKSREMSPFELVDALKAAAAQVGVRIIEDRVVNDGPITAAVRFRLGLSDDKATRKYQRISASPFSNRRKVAAVCWHGHRDFFRVLFRLAGDARIQTASTRHLGPGDRYYTINNFERVYCFTDRNIGAPIAPVMASAACLCGRGD